ncbi:MAG TPA: flagellar biosynthetic protein FliR [Acidimicrobiales bacterium]|nr:flagellar biosynthetic protein FliR [Acidimicrobiales bacterium]
MDLNVNPIWLLAFFLAFIRALAWLVVVPPFSSRQTIPSMALVGIAGGLGILAVPQISHGHVPTDTAGLVGAIVLQIFTGAAMGLCIRILLSAVTAAGGLIDLFGGLNLPPAVDPLSENQTPMIGQFYEQVAMVLLFVTNGELLLVRGFETSFGAAGLTLSSSAAASNVLTADLATFFTATLEIAAPLIVVLFATQISLAMLSKAAPQVNVWILGFPIQGLMSLLFVAIGIRVLPGYVDNLVLRAIQDTGALVGGH